MTGIDWTPVVTGVISVLGGLLGYVLKVYVMPWLTERRLYGAAVTVVNAVEALMRDYGGAEKLEVALQRLADMGFKVDGEALRDAVEAAYYQMHIAQVAAGLKEK